MSRQFQDSNLLKWEAYASGGAHGSADRARIVFHCLTDRNMRARFVAIEGDQADAERAVSEADEARLAELLDQAAELS